MPKILNINNFAKAGLNSDLMPWDLDGSFLTEISNVRISDNKLSPFGGSKLWANLPDGFVPGSMVYVNSVSGSYWLIMGKDSVIVYDGSTFDDISISAGYAGISNEDHWSSCLVSNIPVINHPQDYPQYWSPQNAGVDLEYLPWDKSSSWKDQSETARIIRSHKQFLFAMDLQSGSTEIADGVRWSSPADIGGLPETWDATDINNVAGLTSLGGEGGRMIDGLSMRDAFVVYRENGITVFDYVGGNFVWQIRNLSTTVGLLCANALVEVKGSHYFIGNGDIFLNDGNSISSIMQNRIRKRFSTSISSDNFRNSYAVKSISNSEVWFCIPESGSVHPNIAYIYNWEDDTWSVRDIPEGPFASYGPENSPPITWENIDSSWEGSSGVWDQSQKNPLDDTVIQIVKPNSEGEPGKLLLLEKALTGSDSQFSTNIERVGFALEGLQNVTTISRVYPHISGPGQLFIQVGSQDHPGASVRWKQPVLFTPEKDRKVDVRTTGELHCFRFYTAEGSIYWEMSGMDIEYVNAGLR